MKRLPFLLPALAMVLACAALLGGCTEFPLVLGTPAATGAGGQNNAFLVAMLDVGQGDSILLGSNGHYMLVDAGDNTHGDDVLRALAARGITRLDAVVGTHPDSDHIGGLDTVIDGIDVGAVYMTDRESNTRTYEDVLDAIDRKRLSIDIPTPGDVVDLGEAKITFLWPAANLEDTQDNNHSIVLRYEAQGHSALLTGDVEKRAEKALLQSGVPVKCDILKVAHHGSNSSSSQDFLEAAMPQIALIGVGAGNDYGHPKADVLRRLDGIGATVYRTDRNGAVTVTVVDGKLSVRTEK